MKLFKRLPKGELATYGMAEWFYNLTPAEQDDLKEGYKRMEAPLGIPPERLYEGNISVGDSRNTQQFFLLGLGSCANVVNNIVLAEKIWLMDLDARGDEPITRHFIYNSLIELYYRQRETRADALESSVRYCIEDIERIGRFIAAWKQEEKRIAASVGHKIPKDEEIEIPRIPSFQRLIIIYEKQGKIKEAIELCQHAIGLGLHDNTKGGFEGRLARLQRRG